MKKRIALLAAMALSLSLSAQLAWDTEFAKSDYDNALTVISKSENVSYSNPTLGIGGGLSLGKIVVNIPLVGGDPYEDECVIALPLIGIADSLSFAWQGGSAGSISVYQSPDHNNWSLVITKEGNTIALDTEEKAALATNTRYLKFAATGRTAAVFRKIMVSELKSLSAGTDEWPFGSAMIDDADGTKNVTVNWTNIVAEVTSTDPHFSASLATIGQKNLINQSTQLTIRYTHNEEGTHSGYIVIAGEGKEVKIAVSGQTKKYDQTLTWPQSLDQCTTTDHITFNAFTSSGLDVVYESSNTGVAYVEDGELRIVCAGSVTITASQPGNYKFRAASPISKTFVITRTTPMLGVHVEDITYGQPLCEAAIVDTYGLVDGTFAWQDIDTTVILDAGDYQFTLLFTPADPCIYTARTMPVALHVNKAVQTITWDEQTTELMVGHPVPSTAQLSSGMDITYAYTECLLSIDSSIIMPENEGEVTVVAYHPGNHNYLPTTVVMTTFHITPDPDVPTLVGQSSPDRLSPEQIRSAEKFLHNGHVYLHYAGTTYDALGKKLE